MDVALAAVPRSAHGTRTTHDRRSRRPPRDLGTLRSLRARRSTQLAALDRGIWRRSHDCCAAQPPDVFALRRATAGNPYRVRVASEVTPAGVLAQAVVVEHASDVVRPVAVETHDVRVDHHSHGPVLKKDVVHSSIAPPLDQGRREAQRMQLGERPLEPYLVGIESLARRPSSLAPSRLCG